MRVIVGSARRLLLKTLDGLDTKSTTDRIKGTLFNMFQPDLSDCMFLGLLSGNGAIGVEVSNRGAGLAMMIESNPRVLECIRENLARIKLGDRVMMMGCDMITGLKRLEGRNYRLDTTFTDPPYHHEYERLVLDYPNRSPIVTENTPTVIEASRETDFGWLKESGWYMIRSKKYKINKHVFTGRGEQVRTTVYSGDFDPATSGHYDIIERTAKMVDKLIIRVLSNKVECPLFSTQECVDMLKEMTTSLPNVEIQPLEGPPIDFVRESYADIVIRGLWVIMDFEYELQMAQINRIVVPEIDTIFLTTNLKYSYLSSSTVKEITEYEGDISEFLHSVIAARIRERLKERRQLT